MGTQSQIGLCIAKKPGRVIPDFNAIEEDFQFDFFTEDDDSVLYISRSVKWNKSSIARAVNDYLDTLDAGPEQDFMFIDIRKGKISVRGNHWDNSFDFSSVLDL